MQKWIREKDVFDIMHLPQELWADHIADLDGMFMNDENVEDISLEELKVAADNLGYELVKKLDSVTKLLPCICGNENIYEGKLYWYPHILGYGCICAKCNRISILADTTEKARENWNRMAEDA